MYVKTLLHPLGVLSNTFGAVEIPVWSTVQLQVRNEDNGPCSLIGYICKLMDFGVLSKTCGLFCLFHLSGT